MSKKNDLNMGFDPLEWLRDDGAEQAGEAVEPTTAEDDDAAVVTADATVEVAEVEVTEMADSDEASRQTSGMDEIAADNEVDAPSEDETVEVANPDNGSTDTIITLSDGLHIANVGETHQRMKEAINAGGTLIVDFGGADVIDGAGVQLLLAFAEQARQNGLTLEWREVSDALRRDVALSGTSPAFW